MAVAIVGAMTDTCTDVSFETVLTAGVVWQRWLRHQWGGRIPDLDAELTACLWEQYRAGVTDQDVLFTAARTWLRRISRAEQRAAKALTAAHHQALTAVGQRGDVADRVVERVAAAQIVRRVTVPERCTPWVTAMTNGGAPASPAAMRAGRRWADRVRRDLTAIGARRVA